MSEILKRKDAGIKKIPGLTSTVEQLKRLAEATLATDMERLRAIGVRRVPGITGSLKQLERFRHSIEKVSLTNEPSGPINNVRKINGLTGNTTFLTRLTALFGKVSDNGSGVTEVGTSGDSSSEG